MELKVTKKRLDTNPIRNLLVQGEALVDRPKIVMHRNYEGLDISTLNFELRAVSEKETMVRRPLEKSLKDLEYGLVVLTWTVTKEFTAISGKLELTIVGIDDTGTEIMKITSEKIEVRPDPEGDWVAPPPDVVSDALNQMAVIQAAVIQAKNDTQALKDGTEEEIRRASAVVVAEVEGIRDDAQNYADAAAASAGAASTSAEASAQSSAEAAEQVTAATAKAEESAMYAAQAADSEDKARQYADQLGAAAVGDKGYFDTPEELIAAYPVGEAGWHAMVGSTDEGTQDTLWSWDVQTNAWVNTDKPMELKYYPRWAQLSNKLLVPCTCIYNAATHTFSLTRKDVNQHLADGAELTFRPLVGYTRGDKVEFEGTEIPLEYAGSPVDVQTGAWLAGRPAKLIWYSDEEGGNQNALRSQRPAGT